MGITALCVPGKMGSNVKLGFRVMFRTALLVLIFTALFVNVCQSEDAKTQDMRLEEVADLETEKTSELFGNRIPETDIGLSNREISENLLDSSTIEERKRSKRKAKKKKKSKKVKKSKKKSSKKSKKSSKKSKKSRKKPKKSSKKKSKKRSKKSSKRGKKRSKK